jgi:hypothetical protein
LPIFNIVAIVKTVAANNFERTYWKKSRHRWSGWDVVDDGLGRLVLDRLVRLRRR